MNLPTGCRISDLPGYTEDDRAWDYFIEHYLPESEMTQEELEAAFREYVEDCRR
jgi:hypothetical protein